MEVRRCIRLKGPLIPSTRSRGTFTARDTADIVAKKCLPLRFVDAYCTTLMVEEIVCSKF